MRLLATFQNLQRTITNECLSDVWVHWGGHLKDVLVNASEFFLCDQSNVLFCVKEIRFFFLKMSNLFYLCCWCTDHQILLSLKLYILCLSPNYLWLIEMYQNLFIVFVNM